jgi:hypothetical protein
MSAAFQIFTLPSQQALDTAANVLAGATLTFTLTGTNTPVNAYSDAARTIAVANPLSADAAGVFIPVILDPAVIYRIVLKNQAGGVLKTWDPANERVLSQASIAQFLTYQPFYVANYGAVGDGSADDTVAIQAACDAAEVAGGGEVILMYGAVHKITAEITVGENVSLNMNRATTNHFFGNGSGDVAYDLKDNAAIYNGAISVTGTGTPALTREAWQCVNIGRSGADLGGFTGCRASNLSVASNRNDTVGGVGVLIQAGSSNILVENIDIPSSATMGSGVRIAWAGPGGNPPATSEHPHDIHVRNIKFGAMTKTGSTFDLAGVDIVGAYNISVENISAEQWAGDAFVQIRVGGFGATVAPSTIQPLLFQGIWVRNVSCKLTNGCVVIVNGQANDAAGTPDYSVPAIVENVKSVGGNSPSGGTGIHVLNVFDTIFRNCEISKHKAGYYVEEGAKRIHFIDCRATLNQEEGFFIGHSTAPDDVTLERCEAWLNGQDNNSHAGFWVESANRTVLTDCLSGDASSETTQVLGFNVASSAVDTQFRGRNRVRNIKGGGVRYQFTVAVLGDYHFSGGSGVALSTTATEYEPFGALGLSTTEADVSAPISASLVLTNFQCYLSVAPGSGKNRRFRIVDDGSATSADITIADAAVAGSYLAAVESAAASLMDVISTSSGTPASSRVKWTCEGFRS